MRKHGQIFPGQLFEICKPDAMQRNLRGTDASPGRWCTYVTTASTDMSGHSENGENDASMNV